MKKTIITVLGKDQVGIIAGVCNYLAENDINILDLSQTITGDIFNMMIVANITGSKKKFAQIADEIEDVGKGLGVQIKMQQEDIFNSMHRI